MCVTATASLAGDALHEQPKQAIHMPDLDSNIVDIEKQMQRFQERDWDPLLTIVFKPKDNQNSTPLLAPPPSEDRVLTAEHQALKTKQANRTEKQATVFDRAREDVIMMFIEDLNLKDEEFQTVMQFFYEGWGYISRYVYAEQFYHARRRPTQIFDDLEAFEPLAGSPSYPSDVTAQATFLSLLAADLFPEQDYLFNSWANELSEAFEASAFQFPSDTIAGKKIAMMVFDDYKQTLGYKDTRLNASLSLISHELDVDHFKGKLSNTALPKSFP